MKDIFFAMAAPQGGKGAQGGMMNQMLFLFLPLFLIFYFLILRPQQKKQKEHQQMLTALKKGDRVLTSGGILGTVTNVKEQVVVVKIADSVKVEVTKGSITQVLKKTES